MPDELPDGRVTFERGFRFEKVTMSYGGSVDKDEGFHAKVGVPNRCRGATML